MEKPTTSSAPRSKRVNILKYLSKAASFAIPNQPYSPTGRRHAFQSGPLIPEEARRRKNEAFETQEPTSPKVSCIGQIKHKKKKKCNGDRCNMKPPQVSRKEESKSHRKIFGRTKVRKDGKEEEGDKEDKQVAEAPGLGQMRKFSSGRNSLAGFDWRDKVYADDGDDEDEVIVPHSAPILMGGGGGGGEGVAVEPRKEVNLWRRRSTSHPILDLQLNS